MAHVFISIGSNVERDRHFRQGLRALIEYFPDYIHSDVYESEPVGFSGKNFYNSVFATHTDMPLPDLCTLLKQIERDNGRTPQDKKFSPRTLDLDILFYDDMICDTPAQLPRDEITKNAFVLRPLAEIAPEFVHPVQGCSMAEIWQAYDNQTQKLWKVEFSLS
ncbi:MULTISPECIES: 2-amino-4-hydroxy-6-hydroxymethyldihydropteridine diphosphokinase [unclassified Pseudoalteromonas]|uniref:2-amino-4-hydroxy-6- hydroxymethyldihydropteridine diphosphokinase n=1 Tax=unclassified Pseudoalteromonas TaxID=194690 RepID=UPI002098147B|nr:2-amino-4-hydroxy-6-hydroxymethyldihydropteridine diphosphokinase [Pseudoalteromonas sp. XMcav2-N]MCO7188215.1 2-amino-4-hydroxy-6-hydroxymethyldihydropteridine diphosphokinase [Pseudoalteromonas sp. XMcav2-N]